MICQQETAGSVKYRSRICRNPRLSELLRGGLRNSRPKVSQAIVQAHGMNKEAFNKQRVFCSDGPTTVSGYHCASRSECVLRESTQAFAPRTILRKSLSLTKTGAELHLKDQSTRLNGAHTSDLHF